LFCDGCITTLLGLVALTLGSVFTALAEIGQGREPPWRTMAGTTSWSPSPLNSGPLLGKNKPLVVFASGAMRLICASAASAGGIDPTLTCFVIRACQQVKHERLCISPVWRNLRAFRPSDMSYGMAFGWLSPSWWLLLSRHRHRHVCPISTGCPCLLPIVCSESFKGSASLHWRCVSILVPIDPSCIGEDSSSFNRAIW